MSKKILILMGGTSSEREVSILSGKNIAKALQNSQYDIIEYIYSDTRDLIKTIDNNKIDIIFNALHGGSGENGTISALFDLLKIPYTHSSAETSAIAMNKEITKKIVSSLGIKCPKSIRVKLSEIKDTSFDIPFVVKPVSEGSSIGIEIIRNQKELDNLNYTLNTKLMIEEYIAGQELTVTVLDNEALAVTELKTDEEFYDYNAKYTDGLTQHILPAPIPVEIESEAKNIALKIHKELGFNYVSRSDFRYNPTDGLVFLEVNTHPGMTKYSLVPEQAKYKGMSFTTLCENLIKNASYTEY